MLQTTPRILAVLKEASDLDCIRYEVADMGNRCSAFILVKVSEVEEATESVTVHLKVLHGRPCYWGTGQGFTGDRYSEWGAEETAPPTEGLRRDQKAHAAELEKVEEISLCFCLVDESNETAEHEPNHKLKNELVKRLDDVLWRYHKIPAMNLAIGTVEQAEAEKAKARAEGHKVIHVFPLAAGPETHGIEITMWLVHSGAWSSAAVLRRMYRLERRSNGTEAAVETVEPLVRSVIWQNEETSDAYALEEATRELIETTLDQITEKDPTLGGGNGI